ncbi:hypothetical protein [Tenacibaculum sp. L6]|uniref:hypothetical protein n=1 Tax=Tenacibaculum sp. L6 TaxID=2992764 RepID=UPI00237C2450|nr:hypothetical protein [Tenacibaculum sp. L6]MDE0535133.1 hypothetical protein [Tenacibaculum sp. L6]
MTAIYSKKKLFEKYYYLPEREMRATINEIIAEIRNLPFEVAKHKKKLRPSEVRRFLEVYDLV